MSRVLRVISYPSSLPRVKTCIHENSGTYVIEEVRGDTRPVLGGLEGELLHLIADSLDISLEYYVDEVGWSTTSLRNASDVDGCLGMVVRGEVDFSVAQLGQVEELTSHVDTSYPYIYLTVRFITRLPNYVHKPFAFVEPFTLSTWLSILLLLCSVSLVFHLMQTEGRSTYPRQVFNRFSEMVSQTAACNSKSNIERILLGFWIVGVYIIALCYIAVILKFTIAPIRQSPLDSNEKLLASVKRGNYKVGTPLEIKPILLVMHKSTNPTVRELASYVTKNGWEVSVTKKTFVDHLRNSFALAVTETELKKDNQRGFPVVISQDVIYHCNLVAFMKKNFSLREKLDFVILRIFEGGLYSKILDHLTFQSHLSDDLRQFEEKAIKPLTLSDLKGVFFLFAIGILSSALVLVIEVIVPKFHRLKRKYNLSD